MKKMKVVCFMCSCVIVMSLSACQKESSQATPPVESPTPSQTDISAGSDPAESSPSSQTDASIDSNTVKWVTHADNIDMNGMNLYWQRDNIQFVADENAKLSIYVRADKFENGEFGFDDGQDWAVIMETSLGDYPLFPRQYVQLGGVSCVVFNDYIDDNTISHVFVTVKQTASYQLYDCVFDSDKESFKVIPIYDAKGINFITDSKNY